MNKIDYLNNLLNLCTEKQIDLFNRMYIEGPEKNQISHAIFQLENTLKGLNSSNEELKRVKKEAKEEKIRFDKELISQKMECINLQKEIDRRDIEIERMENPINTENKEVQERLALLDALETGGIDNWIWYDEAINDL